MDPLQLIIEASRADQVLAAQTADPDLQTAIARNRPDLRSALMTNPSIHDDLLLWLEAQGAGPAEGMAREGAGGASADSGAEAQDAPPAGVGDGGEEDERLSDGGADDAGPGVEGESAQDDGAEDAGGLADDGGPGGAEEPDAQGAVAEGGEQRAADDDLEGDTAQDDDAGDVADLVEDGAPATADGADGEDLTGTGRPEGTGPDGAEPGGGEPDDAGPDGAGPDGGEPDDAGSDGAGPDGATADGPAQADSPETIGFPAPPPSAEDIAAWAETPSAAPEAYEPSALAASGSVYAPSYPVQAPYRAQAQEPRRSSTTRLLVGIIVLLLVIIVGGGGALLGSRLSGGGSEDEAGGQRTTGAEADEAAGAEAAGGIPSATSTGPITSCGTAPAVQVMSVTDEQGSLSARVKVTSPCAQGDFLDGAAVRINLYGPSSTSGGGMADAVVASGEFDFSRTPLIIPAEGAALELTYGSGHYFRTAADLAPAGSSAQGVEAMTGKVLLSRASATTLGTQGLVSPGAVSAAETSTDASGEEAAASEALSWYIEQGRSGVRGSLVGRWTPQLSSKRPGLVAEGRTWDARSALAEFLALRQEHTTAVLVDSDEWPVFEPGQGWWVTLAGIPYSSAEEANAWCDAQGYSADHCLAKRMDTTGPPEGTTKSR
ncbi:hypothetical protein [Actinomyces bowdenii]|uniref:Leucine rich repeat variant domain-containing protein n=1 Tax=Actinomyces bowdenii TaxID=131109 RepID=A0A3P1VAW4_9ACTO|nr:hypothetical protein [Actinomyces bowdenii]RRD30888.1 hypothetical protein EII10_02025 [Actinomyces bowdenii]